MEKTMIPSIKRHLFTPLAKQIFPKPMQSMYICARKIFHQKHSQIFRRRKSAKSRIFSSANINLVSPHSPALWQQFCTITLSATPLSTSQTVNIAFHYRFPLFHTTDRIQKRERQRGDGGRG